MTDAARVLCFGIVVMDRVYELDALPRGDGKFTAMAYRETGGGIAGTAAVAIAALGASARYHGAVGDDPAGDWLCAEMARLKVDVSGVQRSRGTRTPSCCALVDAAGERCLIVDRGTVAPLTPPLSALAGIDAVLVDHRFPVEAAALLARVPANVPRVLDAEGGDPAALRKLVAQVEYPIFSRNGLRLCTGEDEPEKGLARADAPLARAVGVTLGERGSLWRQGNALSHIAAPSLPVRDTTGCGDVFHGAFALAIAERQGLQSAIRFATAAAALKARNGAGWRGMASRDEVAALARQDW
jgi:sulfofructose kinase